MWAAAVLSAALLELPFPLAGPHAALAQRLCVVRPRAASLGNPRLLDTVEPSPSHCAAPFCSRICAACSGTSGNCYWIRDTMMHYGDMPAAAPVLLLIGFSLVLGLYFGFFGLGVMLVRRATGSTRLALGRGAFSLGGSRPRRCPHHQRSVGSARLLAGGQRPRESACAVDRRLRHQLLLVAVNALLAGGLLLDTAVDRTKLGRGECAGIVSCGSLGFLAGIA